MSRSPHSAASPRLHSRGEAAKRRLFAVELSWTRIAAGMVLLVSMTHVKAASQQIPLVIPEIKPTAKRPITVDDVVALRRIKTLNVAPDGHRFALFVIQAHPPANEYLTGWFVGSTTGGALIPVGGGGQVRPEVYPAGDIVGELEAPESRWSPDGQWIAYRLRRNGEVQLWRSRADGSLQEQLTHHAADVRDFAWSDDGQALYFTVGSPRAELRAREEARLRAGYRYDEEVYFFTDFMKPQMMRPLETDLSVWAFILQDRRERLGSAPQRAAFEKAQTRQMAGIEAETGFLHATAIAPITRSDGASAWLARSAPTSRILRVVASLSPAGAKPIVCTAEPCSGVLRKVWWSADGKRVLFWRNEGFNETAQGIYAWSPARGKVTTLLRAQDDDFVQCQPAADDRLLCIRETKNLPQHLAALELRSGSVRVLAEVNPELRNIRLGKVERFEWDTPRFEWNEPGGALAGLYAKRAYGYILYPPDFDPSKKYPVFIDPYVAHGFDSASLGSEHPLHAYAASGFVVLNTAFPAMQDLTGRFPTPPMRQQYSAELDFPHLTMFMESTVRGLDTAAARGFVDERRVGIGGVSHGTFVPLYMLQKHDRIAAISISSPTWGPHEYYWGSRKGQGLGAEIFGNLKYEDWRVKPEGPGREYWSRFDIADHVDAIEAPILMQLADEETYALLRLIRHLADEDKPYDAYVFRHETHIKWQPAHLQAIMTRNLDWFRFWLQDYEDPAVEKAEQYARWRELKKLQCKNPRSLRNYCG